MTNTNRQNQQSTAPHLALTEFCKTGSGGTPSRSEPAFYEGGTIPWVKSGELRENIIFDTEEYVTELAVKKTSVKLVPKGSILLAMYGATVGRMAILGIDATTNQAICHIVPDENLAHRDYLYHCLQYKVPELLSKAIGGAQPNISQQIIKNLRIPLPPLAEQQRIAAILDKADALRTKRRAALAKLDTLLQATFLHMFGDPVTNPMGWEVKHLGDIAEFVGGGTPSREKPEYFTGNICWATSKDMKGEFLYDTQEHVTQEAIDNSATKLLPAGNLLVVVKSKILMHKLPVLVNCVTTCFGQDLKGVIVASTFPTAYVARHMRIGQRSLIRQARGVNTEGLTLEHLRNYPVMVPPSSILGQWEETESKMMIQREQLIQSERLSNNLFHTLQQRAFKGEL